MAADNDSHPTETDRRAVEIARRSVLKLAGAGAGLAAIGGATAVGAAGGQEGGDGGDTGDDGDDGHFVEDLIDPTFGYPLAADETGDVGIEAIVELETVEGEGEHANFPRQPGQAEGGGFPFEFLFDPVGLHVQPDEVVHFVSVAGEHTATAFHQKYSNPEFTMPTRVPEGVPGFTSPPIVDGESWLYQFPTRGVYDVLCLPHFTFGMVMRIVVAGPDDDLSDSTFAAPSGDQLPPNVQLVLSAPELEPSNIVDQGEVAWGDLTLEAVGTATEQPTDGTATVQVREHPDLGPILVDAQGMTLYMFDQDTQGEGMSACSGDCAEAWPPLTIDGEPVAGEGVTAELGTFERETGERQVTANGWPLYYFAQDAQPGDAQGQGVSDVWWVLGPDGTPTRSD